MATCLICRELLEDGGQKCHRCHGHYCDKHHQPRHHECSGVDWDERSDSSKIPRPRSPPKNWQKRADRKLKRRKSTSQSSRSSSQAEPLGFLGWFFLLAILAIVVGLTIRALIFFGVAG